MISPTDPWRISWTKEPHALRKLMAWKLSWFLDCHRRRLRGRSIDLVAQAPAPLEARRLLSTLTATYGPIASQPSAPEDLTFSSPLDNPGGSPPFFARSGRPPGSRFPGNELAGDPTLTWANGSPPPSLLADNPGSKLPPLGGNPGPPPIGNRPELSIANLIVNGQPTPELAVANNLEGTLNVFEGSTIVFSVTGLNHPESVKLADLNHDGVPDLIVADSGDNKVLVYSGKAGGGFGPEVTGGVGFSVGSDPVGLTVGDLNGDGQADLIVANKGSNDVSILLGQGTGSGWTFAPASTVRAGIAPVRSLIVRPTPGSPSADLLICNSGSNDVYLYETSPDGQVEAEPSKIIDVGRLPGDFFVGQFSHRPDIDMVTINSGSDNLTYIGGIFTPHPLRQDITLGASRPIAALALSVNLSGASELVVANSDGRIALLQAGDNGLQLTGLSAPTGVNNVTAIAAAEMSSGLDIYEASSGTDSIAILQFDLQDVSVFTSSPSTPLASTIEADGSGLVVEMLSNGGSAVDLVGVLWSTSTPSPVSDDLSTSKGATGSRSAGQSVTSPLEFLGTGSRLDSQLERFEPRE